MMKKNIILYLLIVSHAVFGQDSPYKGFLPPRMTTAQRNAILSPPPGLMIYNTTVNCMQNWNASLWISKCAGSMATLNCSGATNNGTLTSGTAASGVSSVISYTGGNGGTHNGQTVVSTGVTGLTATLSAGNFANGNGSLTYTITGTPASSGTANFAINIDGKTCTLIRTVILPPTPPSTNFCGNIYLGSFPNFSTASDGKTVTGTISGSKTTPNPSSPRYCTGQGFADDYSMLRNANTTTTVKFNKPIGYLWLRIRNPNSQTPVTEPTFWKNGVRVYPTITTFNFRCDPIDNAQSRSTDFYAKNVWFDEVRYTPEYNIDIVFMCIGAFS